ncbi:MAG: hypothetical protein OXE84_02645, partial [Rhodobacteraceae bacterium]|nr:hypothetical protein [Paracoccaceae bacterium]
PIFQQLVKLAYEANTDMEEWLEGAVQGVQFLERTCAAGDEIILFALGPHCLVHSVLVPQAAVNPPDHEDISQAHIRSDDTWCIQKIYGGGEGHRIYLESPLSSSGSQTLAGGEKLIFRRHFEGVKSYHPQLEISQKLVHAHELYFMDERRAYCRLDAHGDIENVITLHDDEHSDPHQRVQAVTIRSCDLEVYMALSETVLVTQFDFTRFLLGNFSSWDGAKEQIQRDRNLFYRWRVIPNHASYANGHLLFYTKLSEDTLVQEWKAEENSKTKQYASFKILDRKNKRQIETSCGPEHIVNYFTESELPLEISPAFFRPEVLQKYKQDIEKYTISDRSISCRGAWDLKSYDINEAGQVHAYIGDLAKLPFEEQLYWKSFNEWPKGNISNRAFQNDILGEVSTEDNPLAEVRRIVALLNREAPAWWCPREDEVIYKVLGCAADSIEEWGNEILAFDQMVNEGFRAKGLRLIIESLGSSYNQKWRSLKLLEVVVVGSEYTEDQAKEMIRPLKELHNLRTLIKAHSSPNKRQLEASKARRTHGTLRDHFQDLAGQVRDSIKQVVLILRQSALKP